MSLTDNQKVRIEIGDTDINFPFLSDEEYQYFLDKNNQNIGRAALDAAKTILFVLAQQNSETVDIFSIRNTSSEQYRLALELYIKNPALNPMMDGMTLYVGGISKSDIHANNANPDNNVIHSPDRDRPLSLRFPLGWTFSGGI